MFGTWLAVCTMLRFTVAGLKMLISLFWRAGTSWLSSEKNWKTSLLSLPGVPQYFGLRTRTTDWLGL